MTFKSYKEFCESADIYKNSYKNINKVKNIKLKNDYMKCWKDYVYELNERTHFKHLIWNYLNDSINLKELTYYYFKK